MSQNNTNTATLYAGIDVAKAKLDVSIAGKHHTVSNDPKGHQALLGLITRHTPQGGLVHTVIEASGGYEMALVKNLHAAHVPLSVVQPARVRYFARACNQLAKSDPLDAHMLAAFGHAVRPAPAMPLCPRIQRLSALVNRRSQLVAAKVQHGNQAELHGILGGLPTSSDKLVRKQFRQMEALIEKQLEECEAAIAATIAEDAALSARNERLQQVKGVGPVTAFTLLAYMPELGHLSDEAAAALAGLAPYNNDSGPRKGTRSIRGGRKEVRTVLYMAAMCAVRSDSILKAFHNRLTDAGKKPLVALTAVMRKLIVLLNRLLKNPHFKLAHPST